MFKNIFIVFSFLILTACGQADARLQGGITAHNHSSQNTGGGSLNLSGNLSSTKTCLTGYARVNPNFCLRDPQPTLTSLTTSVCTNIESTADAVDVINAGAKYLYIYSISRAGKAGSALARYTTATYYYSTDCTGTGFYASNSQGYEEVASAAGDLLEQNSNYIIVPKGVRFRKTSDAGDSGFSQYRIMGYFD